jgi:hypothetical protein
MAPAMAVAHIAFFMALQPAIMLSALAGATSEITSATPVDMHWDEQAVRLA